MTDRNDRAAEAKQAVYLTGSTHPEWGSSFLVGEVWWCGDYHCDCTQAQINRIEPNLSAGRPWIRREEVWRGPFHSYSSEEPGLADRELAERLAQLEADGSIVVVPEVSE